MAEIIAGKNGESWRPDSWPIVLSTRLPHYLQTRFDQDSTDSSEFRPSGTIGSADQDLSILFHNGGVDLIGFYTGPAAKNYREYLRQLGFDSNERIFSKIKHVSSFTSANTHFFYVSVPVNELKSLIKGALPFIFREHMPSLNLYNDADDFKTGPETTVVVHSDSKDATIRAKQYHLAMSWLPAGTSVYRYSTDPSNLIRVVEDSKQMSPTPYTTASPRVSGTPVQTQTSETTESEQQAVAASGWTPDSVLCRLTKDWPLDSRITPDNYKDLLPNQEMLPTLEVGRLMDSVYVFEKRKVFIVWGGNRNDDRYRQITSAYEKAGLIPVTYSFPNSRNATHELNIVTFSPDHEFAVARKVGHLLGRQDSRNSHIVVVTDSKHMSQRKAQLSMVGSTLDSTRWIMYGYGTDHDNIVSVGFEGSTLMEIPIKSHDSPGRRMFGLAQ